MKITIENIEFSATFEDNSTAKAFKKILPLTLTMNDYANNEKVVSIESLPTNTCNQGIIQKKAT